MLGAVASAVALLAASPIQGSVFGPVVSVKGTTFTITTSLSPNGKSVVSASSAKITEQAAAPRSSLEVGACVMATGARNSKGVVAATRITLSAPVKGTCGGGFTFRRPGSGGANRPPRTGGSPPAGGFQRSGNFGFAFGLVTKMSGSTLTVKGSFGPTKRTTTVTVSSKTSLSHTIAVTPSDLKLKECAFVRGASPDRGKTVKATDVALTPERNGSCANGFRRPGS